ncbi:GNAT family N-acetyltransferase [Chitinophaga sp. SYP-B3965]|uniref:GNAT family N-acetyltransferase n=1 Tax=Chitinophaga sp. SYP-B3965 TaxID=2663120 RepID=UPI0012998AD8|nr:GNAT family N-acetyltransferase [Chitinophaga sp. SYP-B3965]MRG48495.1 GNAT family N-acetyltransferase [Chitinophaga sp. SYP-B3965]
MLNIEKTRGEYRISTDKNQLQVDVIYQYLSEESYWAKDIPRSFVERSIENSLCFGIYHGKEQVGFARVITDFATFGYLADVFVAVPHRKKGLSKWLMEVILEHPDLSSLRRFMLATQDAHGLYKQFGFKGMEHPERLMGKIMPVSYTEMKKSL